MSLIFKFQIKPDRSSQKAPVNRYIIRDLTISGECCIEQHNEYENGYKYICYHM